MVNQNKIFSFKIKQQAEKVFPSDVEWIVGAFDEYAQHTFFVEK